MPINKLCNTPGCSNIALSGSCKCDKHYTYTYTKPFANAKRSNIFYNTPEWRSLRKEALIRDDYTCVICGSKENLEVDHIIPPRGRADLFFNLDNLQTLCSSCHKSKTAREILSRKD